MKRNTSILFIALFLLAGHRASGEERGVMMTGGDQSIPTSIQSRNMRMTHCDSLLTIGYDDMEDGLWEQSYNALRLFMEQCPFYVSDTYNSGVYSWDGFTDVGGTVTSLIANHKTNHVPLDMATDTVDLSNPEFLYWEAQKWDHVDPIKALDTMLLFVQRHPNDISVIANALGYTVTYTSEMSIYDSAGKSWVDIPKWLDEYNWLASVYQIDTIDTCLQNVNRFEETVLADMASAEIYFDRNGAANLDWNIAQLFPFSATGRYEMIAMIRAHQKEIPEDTTPFHIIPIPPLPYGVNYVMNGNQIETLDLRVNPNPADAQLTTNIEMPFGSDIDLELYDALGRDVKQLSDSRLNMGSNQLTFDCSQILAGSYFLRLAADGT